MPEERARRLFGPALLILVGVALLLQQLGVWTISWARLLPWWPLILILLGADILLSRTRAGRWAYLLLVVAAVTLMLLAAPPSRVPREYEQETVAYPLESWREATVRVQMGVGRLVVSALEGSDDLMRADITHDRSRSSVMSSLDRLGDRAVIELKSTAAALDPTLAAISDVWEVRLSPELPLTLEIEGGVSRSEINLTGLSLARLDLNVGVGDVQVTLAERAPYEAEIHGGVGRLVVTVPADSPARIRVDEGLGSVDVGAGLRREGNSFVTASYHSDQPAIEVNLEGGIGAISLR